MGVLLSEEEKKIIHQRLEKLRYKLRHTAETRFKQIEKAWKCFSKQRELKNEIRECLKSVPHEFRSRKSRRSRCEHPLTGRAAAQYQEITLQYRLDELEMICYRQINEGAEGQLKVGVPKSLVDRRTVQAKNELRFFLDQNPSESDLSFDHKTFAAAKPLRHLRAYPRLNNFQRSWGDKPGS